jgi:signal transduction histidine kinase
MLRRRGARRIGATLTAELWPARIIRPGRAATISAMRRVRHRLVAVVRVVAGLLGVGVAVGAWAIAEGPGRFTTYAGSSVVGTTLTVFAGLGLVAAGLAMSLRRRAGRVGDLALLAGITWFAPAWVGWQEGPPILRTIAMALAGLTFPLVLNLALTYPEDRVRARLSRALVVAVYLEALFAALLFALFRDPYFDPGCWANCTVNSFLVRSLPSLAQAVEIADRWFVATAAVTLIAISAARLIRGSPAARRTLALVAAPAIVVAGSLSARAIALQVVTVDDPLNSALFAIFAVGSVAITLLSAGLIWAVVRTRIQRRAVDRIVADLDEAPSPGSLQSALAVALGDHELQIAYWLPESGQYVDANGHTVAEPVATPGRTMTRLVSNERTIAVIAHAGAVPELESHIGPAVRLGLDNERLQAEVLAQLAELRASRARIVETVDGERRRLERDLHDGAQQRLLALSYDIRLARASAEANHDAAAATALTKAIAEAQGALEELRELAHGIYPAVLTEAGLVPALATLADTSRLPIQILGADDRRYPAPVETAAYYAVTEAIEDAARRGASHATVSVVQVDETLVLSIDTDGSEVGLPMVALAADRVGALGGSVRVAPTSCRVEIPCV